MNEPTVIEVPGLRPVIAFPREAVLEIEHVAAGLDISKRHAERQHFPCFYLGTRTRRYLWGAVLDHCARKTA